MLIVRGRPTGLDYSPSPALIAKARSLRELNACPPSGKQDAAHDLWQGPTSLSVHCQRQAGSGWLQLSQLVPRIQRLILAWDTLTEFQRDVVLLYAQPLEAERQWLDLRQVIDRAVRLVSPHAAHRGVCIKIKLPPEPMSAFVDDSQLCRVVEHLLSNALDAVGTEGVIWVALELRGAKDQLGVVVEIADNGCGITPGIRQSLFKPFVSDKESGIGLPSARSWLSEA